MPRAKVKDDTEEVTIDPPASNGHRKMLSLDEIIAVDDLQTEDVHVPEWGGWVTVHGLTGRDRDAFDIRFGDQHGVIRPAQMDNFRAWLVAHTLAEPGTDPAKLLPKVDALGAKSAVALERVFDVAARLSAVGPSDFEAKAEGLKADPSGTTGSD